MQQVLVCARISDARGATGSQRGSRPQAKTFSNKMLKFSLRYLIWVAHNRGKTDRVKTRGFCPRGTKVNLPQGLKGMNMKINFVYLFFTSFRCMQRIGRFQSQLEYFLFLDIHSFPIFRSFYIFKDFFLVDEFFPSRPEPSAVHNQWVTAFIRSIFPTSVV